VLNWSSIFQSFHSAQSPQLVRVLKRWRKSGTGVSPVNGWNRETGEMPVQSLVGCPFLFPRAQGDGWELLLMLRERGIAPERAIALSGWSSQEDLLNSKAAGFETHLKKPLAPGVPEAALSNRNGAA
jgi:CheY-like chemotaxis protein